MMMHRSLPFHSFAWWPTTRTTFPMCIRATRWCVNSPPP